MHQLNHDNICTNFFVIRLVYARLKNGIRDRGLLMLMLLISLKAVCLLFDSVNCEKMLIVIIKACIWEYDISINAVSFDESKFNNRCISIMMQPHSSSQTGQCHAYCKTCRPINNRPMCISSFNRCGRKYSRILIRIFVPLRSALHHTNCAPSLAIFMPYADVGSLTIVSWYTEHVWHAWPPSDAVQRDTIL